MLYGNWPTPVRLSTDGERVTFPAMRKGIAVSPGVAIGTAYCLHEIFVNPQTKRLEDKEVTVEELMKDPDEDEAEAAEAEGKKTKAKKADSKED